MATQPDYPLLTADEFLAIEFGEKKAELDTIVVVDIAAERLRIVQRTGAHGWAEQEHEEPFDLPLPSMAVTIPHAEIFARD